MFRKLLSRKFLVAVGALVADTVGLHLPPELVALAGVYIAGESVADAAGALRAKGEK